MNKKLLFSLRKLKNYPDAIRCQCFNKYFIKDIKEIIEEDFPFILFSLNQEDQVVLYSFKTDECLFHIGPHMPEFLRKSIKELRALDQISLKN